MLIEAFGRTINLSQSGQLEFRAIVAPYLKRVDRGPKNHPLRLYPPTNNSSDAWIVSIDPKIQFGRPCVAGTRIKTEVLFERFKAGDNKAALAKDYDLTARQVEEAISYEQGAA